jgi:glycosyltransferase involved in cell wall biosynthesis
MKICFIALGEFSHVYAYLDYFANRGHEIHLVALEPGPERRVATHNVGLNGRVPKLLGKCRYLPAMLRARKLVRALRPDVVHAQYATSAGLAAWMVNVHPWMVTAHGTDVMVGAQSRLWRTLLRAIFRRADCVNPVSNQLREIIINLGTPARKIQTFTLGVDTRLFGFNDRCFLPSGHLRLICTRRLEELYDHATIVQSMAILKKRGVQFRLTIVGNGNMLGALQDSAAKLELNEWVRFAGEVPNRMLPAYLAEQDIYLSASPRDGASLCLLEAMSCGVYPVVSDTPANSEWITHGRNGLLHRTSDPQSLADCIESALGDRVSLGEAARFNRDLVVKRGDRATNMKRLEELYLNLCPGAKGGVL